MGDPFALAELRIKQPGKLLPGRTRFDIFDTRGQLLATAEETESRSVLQAVTREAPGTRFLAVRTATGDPVLTMVKRDSDGLAECTGPDGELLGRIKIGSTRRTYTLRDDQDQVVARAAGDLSVTKFTVTAPSGERYAEFKKTFAGIAKELLTEADHYTLKFTAPIAPPVRTLIVMVPIVLDLTRHGPY